MKFNIRELSTGKVGGARQKAIKTLAGKWGVSQKEARVRQAWIISQSKLRESPKKKKSIPKNAYYLI